MLLSATLPHKFIYTIFHFVFFSCSFFVLFLLVLPLIVIVRNADLSPLVSVPTGELVCSLNRIIFTIILLLCHYHFSWLPPWSNMAQKCWSAANKLEKKWKLIKVLSRDYPSLLWIWSDIKGLFVELKIGVKDWNILHLRSEVDLSTDLLISTAHKPSFLSYHLTLKNIVDEMQKNICF